MIGQQLVDDYTVDCELENYDYLFQRKRSKLTRKSHHFQEYFNDDTYLPTLMQLVHLDGHKNPFEFTLEPSMVNDD